MTQFISVSIIVLVNIANTLLLRYATDFSEREMAETIKMFFIGFFLFVVLVTNFFKFLLWGFIHKKFDLSNSYPITSIFYPAIYFIAIIKGEAILEVTKLIGIALILFGIILVNRNEKKPVQVS